jgi:hypothetical protein
VNFILLSLNSLLEELNQTFPNIWPLCVLITLGSHFLIIKPPRCTNFSNLFWNETLQVSDSFSVHHQELFTVHSAVVYVIQICRKLSSSRIRIHPDPAVYKPVWHIPLLSLRRETPDDGQRKCPKHVEFHIQNKFENLVHLVGFIIRQFVTMHGHMNVKVGYYVW